MSDTSTARRMWVRFEPYHDVTYFTPESRAATDELGCKGGWMGYFGMRAAPLGAVGPERVTEVFHNFHPRMVARAIPDAWGVAAPWRYLSTRLVGVDGALRRLLGEDLITSDLTAEAAVLARSAAEQAPTDGLPLAAANQALTWPERPHLALWQATTLLREARGDGHVAALRDADLDGCQTLVIFAADHGLAPDYLQQARGWSPAEWDTATEELAGRGLVERNGTITDAGRALRRELEARTDEAAAAPWDALGADATARLADLLEPLSRQIAEGNEAMAVNPMAFDARALLR